MYLVVQVAAKPPKQNHLPPIQPAPQNLENKAPIPEQTTNEHEQPTNKVSLKFIYMCYCTYHDLLYRVRIYVYVCVSETTKRV